MTPVNGLYEPIGIGEVVERLERLAEGVDLLTAVLRMIVKELPPGLDAERIALMGIDCAMRMENYTYHILERLENGGRDARTIH